VEQLGRVRHSLVDWLVRAAYPLWLAQGIDARNGGFVEALGQNGRPLALARRARVQPRQIYAFSRAATMGFSENVTRTLLNGMVYFCERYQRPDGLYRTLVGPDGEVLDDRAVLYDQAFALLGFAALAAATGKIVLWESRALALLDVLEWRFAAGDGAFYSDEERGPQREANPHMHLLEACLAWAELGTDRRWVDLIATLVELAVTRFVRPETGAIGESFHHSWRPSAGPAGRIIEPGHQFEWAWLLLRGEAHHSLRARDVALRLIEIGEQFGVRDNAAINALNDDLMPMDASARLWPQTERIKAALLAESITKDPRYFFIAHSATTMLVRYLDTAVPGLWIDEFRPDGQKVTGPSPASSFYHLVGAITELSHADQSLFKLAQYRHPT
jgi:mannose/cellobiose epimerase-like protein (N-acyl-D-glucosamine 2-epimerase family)